MNKKIISKINGIISINYNSTEFKQICRNYEREEFEKKLVDDIINNSEGTIKEIKVIHQPEILTTKFHWNYIGENNSWGFKITYRELNDNQRFI